MDNKYYSYGLAFILLSVISYILFEISYVIFGLRGFLIIAGILFVISILYGLWYSTSFQSRS